MPYYPEDQSDENLKKLVRNNTCIVCGERLDQFIDPESHKIFIACKDYLRTQHEGIGRAHKPSLIEEDNYEGGIRRMAQVEQEHGPGKARSLAKYQSITTLTQKDAMEIMETIWPKAPPADKKAAAILCASYNLNPLMNHVFLIKFNKKKGDEIIWEEWVRVLGIKAKRLLSSRTGAVMYLDMSPRLMTNEEQITVWGKVDADNICFMTHLKDANSGAEAYGYGKWPKDSEPYGTDKGNTKENMAGIRSESQGLDRLRPGEMPTGVEVMDEQYLDKGAAEKQYEVTTGEEDKPTELTPTTAELKNLFTTATKKGWDNSQVTAVMIRLYDKGSSLELNHTEVENLLSILQAGPPETQPAEEQLPF